MRPVPELGGYMRETRTVLLLGGVVLALTACSVTVPRDGWSNVRAGGGGLSAPGGQPTAHVGAQGGGLASTGGDQTGSGTSLSGISSGSGSSSGSSGTGLSGPAAAGEPTAAGTSSSSGGPTSSGGDSTGVTASSIKVSVLAQYSGTVGPVLSDWYDNGFGTWRDYVNSHGGINGRQIISYKIDTMDTPEGGVAACKQVQSNGSFVAIMGEGVNANVPVIQCLEQNHIPALYDYTDPRLNGLKTSYSMVTGFDDGAKYPLPTFIRNYLHDANQKVGVLYRSDSAPYSIAAKDFVTAARAQSLNVVDVESVTSGQADYTAQMLHLEQSNASVVAVFGDQEITTAVRDAKAIGYSPQWVGPPSWSVDTIASTSPGLLSGIKTIRAVATANMPGYERFSAEAKAQGKTAVVPDELFFYAFGTILGAALQHGGRDLTRQGLLRGMQGMTGFDTGVSPPLQWSSTNLTGTTAVYPVVCCDSQNRWEDLGPPQSTF